MSHMFILFTFAVVCSLARPTLATKGGHEGSGGGNAQYSTVADLRAAVIRTPELATSLIHDIYNYGLLNPENTQDRPLQEALSKIFGRPKWQTGQLLTEETALLFEIIGRFTVANENIMSSRESFDIIRPLNGLLQLTEQPSCLLKTHSEASTSNRRKAPICFSVSSLQRLTPQNLQAQLVGLFFHEISHQYDYEEELAQKIQNEIMRAYLSRAFAAQLNVLMSENSRALLSPTHVCSKLGSMAALATDVIVKNKIREDLLNHLETTVKSRYQSALLSESKNAVEPSSLKTITGQIIDAYCVQNILSGDDLKFSLTLIDTILKSQ